MAEILYGGKSLRDWFETIKCVEAIDTEDCKYLDYDTWQTDRRKAQTDLFWLCKDIFHLDLMDDYVCPNHGVGEPHDTKPTDEDPCNVCGERLIPVPWGIPPGTSIHRAICNFFVHKNPDMIMAKQDEIKERLLLVPRGCFKSTMDEIDCVQWIICFPNVRVSLFTAVEDLGVQFVSHVRKRFMLQADKKGENKKFTRFQLLFPEHCILPTAKEAEDQFTSPGRFKSLVDPTIIALSLKQSTSGIHTDVGKFDDCVSNSNSGPGTSQEQRETVAEQIRLTRGVVELYGYRDNIGTPYDERDAYAYKIANTAPENIRTLIKPALEVKKESRSKKEEELVESDYQLLFPIDAAGNPRLTYAELMKIKQDDTKVYCCQYLCKPSASRQVKFTEHLLRSHIMSENDLPQAPDVENFSVWDTAWSVESGSDFTVGCVVSVNKKSGQGVIRELVRGRFGKQELPLKVADQGSRWNVTKIAIEGIPGAEASFDGPIKEMLRQLGKEMIPVEFFPVDRAKNAKELRAEMIENYLMAGRLYFSSNMGNMDEMIHEFLVFKPHSKRKDDMVDAIAHCLRFLPTMSILPQTPTERARVIEKIMRDKMELERLFPTVMNEDPNYSWSPRPEIQVEPLPMDSFEIDGMKYPVFKNPEEQIYGK